MTDKEKLDKIRVFLNKVIKENNWAKGHNYDSGSMSEANDIGMCHGKTEVAEEILKILNK